MKRAAAQAAWPPSRNGPPTCPVCGHPITQDPGPAGTVVLGDDPLVGRYAHRDCAATHDPNDQEAP